MDLLINILLAIDKAHTEGPRLWIWLRQVKPFMDPTIPLPLLRVSVANIKTCLLYVQIRISLIS